jgi:thioredoxin-like negative regulator of GroEL
VIQAAELLEAVVEAQETLAADHPSRLASQHVLALAYHDDGRTQEAVDLLKHVVAIKVEWHVSEHWESKKVAE